MAQLAENDTLSSNADTLQPFTGPCLLPLLQPVRYCLHSFLTSKDAVRFMQASRSTTASVLSGYAALDHVFTFPTTADAKRSMPLYARHHIHILRMSLPGDWNESLADSESGQSLLPASLIALTLGPEDFIVFLVGTVVYAAFNGSDRYRWEVQWDGKEETKQLNELFEHWQEKSSCDTWDIFQHCSGKGSFNQPIPPGALPHGLRFLQFNDNFNQPLQVGSIPDTVEVIQFGAEFNQPLDIGHLPASLTRLIFSTEYNQPLLAGVLPTSLRQLNLGVKFGHQIQPGTLPPQLQGLSMGWDYLQPILPGVIPPSVTHLRLSRFYDTPLQVGSIPHGVVLLHLGGDSFNQPLLPGVLPTSLRELVIGRRFNQVLQPGSLPDGLKLLAFDQQSYFSQTLQPGVIPASVVAVSLGEVYKQKLVSGGIPSTVKWLRLPWDYEQRDLSGVLSPSTHVVYWQEQEDYY